MAVVHVTDDNFDKEVMQSDKPVMVDFFAEWCGPCKMAAPIIDELSEEYDGKAVIAKLDVDANNATAGKFGVMSIPTVVVFKNGEEVDRKIGFAGKAGYEEMLKKQME